MFHVIQVLLFTVISKYESKKTNVNNENKSDEKQNGVDRRRDFPDEITSVYSKEDVFFGNASEYTLLKVYD